MMIWNEQKDDWVVVIHTSGQYFLFFKLLSITSMNNYTMTYFCKGHDCIVIIIIIANNNNNYYYHYNILFQMAKTYRSN